MAVAGLCLKGGGRGKGGVYDPKVCVPCCKFQFFSHWSLWSRGGGGGPGGEGLTLFVVEKEIKYMPGCGGVFVNQGSGG